MTVEELLGRYLSLRPRSEQEVRRYLHQKSRKYGISDEQIEELVQKYKRLGFIDDAKFTESVVHSAVTNKAKGKRFIAMKLKMAGIETETASSALSAIQEEDLQKAMEKRLHKSERRWVNLDRRSRYAKAYSVLLASGFSSSEIRPFLDEWIKSK